MRGIIHIIGFLVIVFVCHGNLSAQSGKPFKGKKHTSRREIEKKKREAAEKEQEAKPFAPVVKQGLSSGEDRDDLLWKAETANTCYKGSGNISLTEPSRYGIRNDLEIQSYLIPSLWIPNVFLKKRWMDKKWIVSSRHGIYSATPANHFAQSHQYNDLIDSTVSIPFTLSFKNELLLSYPFIDKYSCAKNKPLWILTLGAGIDFGVSFADNHLKEIPKHFMANRSPALNAYGYYTYIFARGDVQFNRIFALNAGLKLFQGEFSGNLSLEQKTMAETFITPRISFSAGYMLSIANYDYVNTVGFCPLADITWYFGYKQSREKGLWGKNPQ